LTTARIMIEDGAYFKGSIEIDRTASPSTSRDTDVDKPAYTRAAAVSPTAAPAHASVTKSST
jgi:hypothetical protein